MEWQTAPNEPPEGQLLAALRVYSAKDGGFLTWDVHLLTVFEGRIEIDSYQGWDWEDYELWCPIPKLPHHTTINKTGAAALAE